MLKDDTGSVKHGCKHYFQMSQGRGKTKCSRRWWTLHLIWVVDSDFQPPQYLSLWWVLIHGHLKHVLRAVLPIESRWVIVQVHHTDHHSGHPVVHQLALRGYFWSLERWSKIKPIRVTSVCMSLINCKQMHVFFLVKCWDSNEWRTTYPDFNVKDLSLQINGESQQGDTAACFIDAKNTIITCRDRWTLNFMR